MFDFDFILLKKIYVTAFSIVSIFCNRIAMTFDLANPHLI